jgi:4-alpha-glucanotransferase
MKRELTAEQHNQLTQLAVMMGIQTRYHSAFGTEIEAGAESLVAVLNALGVPIRANLSNIDVVCADQMRALWAEAVDPVAVFWEGRARKLKIRHSAKTESAGIKVSLKEESGRAHEFSFVLKTLPVTRRMRIDGANYLERTLAIKPVLPPGYHQATVSLGDKSLGTVLVIAAPWKAYQFPRSQRVDRALGVFAPLYAVHSPDSWGIGDWSDLGKLVDKTYAMGGDFVGTLPMLATFNDRPMVEPSPYSPVSRVFWSETYIDPRQTPEWALSPRARKVAESPAFVAEVSRLQAAAVVDYKAVSRLKRTVVQELARCFFEREGDKTPEFKAFLKLKPTVLDYAQFRAVCDASGKVFQKWPERLEKGVLRSGDYIESDVQYYLYSQWVAHVQLAELARTAKRDGQGIYIDFPLSANAAGFDVWRERDSFSELASAGCPPDPAHVLGQDWGILPLHPTRIRENGYRYVRQCLENHMRYAGMLRLDHVMAFYRLYWVPRKLGAKAGAYVRYAMDEVFALLCLESHRNQCVLIGEDLGTVPPEIRKAMDQHKILRMYVQQRRFSLDPGEPLSPTPENCISSLNTHDMPPFAAYWAGLDIVDKMKLGYYGRDALAGKFKDREKQKAVVVNWLIKTGRIERRQSKDVKAIVEALLRWTASGPAQVMQVNIEDLWLETHFQNVPGTWKERPNWRRKCRYGVTGLRNVPGLLTLFADLVARRRK